jgi:hypothetical protein
MKMLQRKPRFSLKHIFCPMEMAANARANTSLGG